MFILFYFLRPADKVASCYFSSTKIKKLCSYIRWKYYFTRIFPIHGIFLSVYRVRPRDPNEDARSDEDFEDEKLVLDEHMLERAMQSRVGGKERDNANDIRTNQRKD